MWKVGGIEIELAIGWQSFFGGRPEKKMEFFYSSALYLETKRDFGMGHKRWRGIHFPEFTESYSSSLCHLIFRHFLFFCLFVQVNLWEFIFVHLSSLKSGGFLPSPLYCLFVFLYFCLFALIYLELFILVHIRSSWFIGIFQSKLERLRLQLYVGMDGIGLDGYQVVGSLWAPSVLINKIRKPTPFSCLH